MTDLDRLTAPWQEPALSGTIAQGDMPGDKICITEEHIQKAKTLYPELRRLLARRLGESPCGRAVVTVCGGSGVGKSEIASLISYYLNAEGVGAYTLSGDNYPRRYPEQNDAERRRVFHDGGLKGLVASGAYRPEQAQALRELWPEDGDASPANVSRYPWLATYQQAGKNALRGYLGTEKEIDFDQVSHIVSNFKQGAPTLYLKRMGRTAEELWYDAVDMTGKSVLVIEWTHGNSDWYEGVDIPVLLNSTPAETLAHRQARNRDGRADSPFTTMVLELEQQMLKAQAHKAKLILSKSGELMTYEQYTRLMAQA